ncbi:hypothetical protein A5816_002958 [Enterococcus sp. 3G1_DIV0629]|nr:hypothetical protein A5816_002958 [Enterococcus sp. 3G1_DIV0629]
MSIHCYYEQERFILGLNKQNQTLNFVTDTSMDTPLDSGAGDYLTITVQDKEGKQKYQMQANAEDSPSQLINALNGKAYENGDHITVQHKNSGKIGLYVKGTLQLDYGNSQNSEEFVIQNNQLLQYDPEAINVTVKEGETTVGEAVEPNELIESGQSNYTYTFVKEPNYYQYGEQTVQIKVTDDQGKTTVVETTLVIKHESELTISTKDTTDERLTIKIDSTTHQLQGITDPKNTAAFSATSEPEVLVMALYNQNNELRQMIALDGGVAPQDCMNELSKQTVEIGDYLTITSKEGVSQSLYREGTNVQTTNESTSTYQINAQWQFEPRKTPTPPDEGGNENSSATKIDADVLIEFSKDNTPVQPVDPNDPTIPVDPTDPINPIGGELMITYTSKLDFGTHKKGGTSWFAYGDRMQGNVPITPFVSIKDTRSTDRKGWSLTAQLETSFVNEKGQPLNGAELHFSHLYSGNGELNAPEVTEGDLVVDKAGVEIARATEKNGYGQHSIGLGKLQADNTTNGVELTIPKGIANDSGNYQATILYTLTADPTAAFKE